VMPFLSGSTRAKIGPMPSDRHRLRVGYSYSTVFRVPIVVTWPLGPLMPTEDAFH
jgi:hypothetical protein